MLYCVVFVVLFGVVLCCVVQSVVLCCVGVVLVLVLCCVGVVLCWCCVVLCYVAVFHSGDVTLLLLCGENAARLIDQGHQTRQHLILRRGAEPTGA